MSEILDKLFKTNIRIDLVNEKLKNVAKILSHPDQDLNIVTTKPEGILFNNTIDLTTIYQNNEITITYGIWKFAHHAMPEHIHHDSLEYLICTKGSVAIKIAENIYTLKVGDYFMIAKGINHLVTSLEDDTMVFAICIPPEKAYLIKE